VSVVMESRHVDDCAAGLSRYEPLGWRLLWAGIGAARGVSRSRTVRIRTMNRVVRIMFRLGPNRGLFAIANFGS